MGNRTNAEVRAYSRGYSAGRRKGERDAHDAMDEKRRRDRLDDFREQATLHWLDELNNSNWSVGGRELRSAQERNHYAAEWAEHLIGQMRRNGYTR